MKRITITVRMAENLAKMEGYTLLEKLEFFYDLIQRDLAELESIKEEIENGL